MVHASTGLDQWHQDGAVIAVVRGWLADADDLGLGPAGRRAPPQRVLASTDGELLGALLGHRDECAGGVLAGHQLVDEPARGGTGPGDEGGAHAVTVDWRRGEGGDGVLVEVAGDENAGVASAELVELRPDAVRQRDEVAGVDAYGAQLRTRDLHTDPDGLGDVERVDQQGGADTERLHLRRERVPLGIVHQGERVRAGAGCRDAVGAARLEVRRGGEPDDVGGTRRRDRRPLLGAARSHLDARPAGGSTDHPRPGRRDRRVVVEDRQQQGLEDDRLGERALDDEDRRRREVHLAIRVAPDVTAEAVLREPVAGGVVDDLVLAQPGDLVCAEAEALQRIERSAGAGHDAVATPRWKASGEHLEHRTAPGRAVGERRLQHRQLVVVREQGG